MATRPALVDAQRIRDEIEPRLTHDHPAWPLVQQLHDGMDANEYAALAGVIVRLIGRPKKEAEP